MKKAPFRGAYSLVYTRLGGRSFAQLVHSLEASGAFHFLVFVRRVASCLHPCRKEHATFFCLCVVGERLFAFFCKAGFACIQSSTIAFALGEQTAVLFTLATPAHAGATVEQTDTAARNQHVELALLNVATDVRCHDDENLAFEFRVVHFTFVLALAVKLEGIALAARTAVCCWYCSESVGEAIVHDFRNLACAGHEATAAADASATPVGAFFSAFVGALLGVIAVGVFGPRAVGLAAVPVTARETLSAFSTIDVLEFDARFEVGCRRCNSLARRRLRLLRLAACRFGSRHAFAIFIVGIVIAVYFARFIVGVFFAFGTSLLIMISNAFVRGAVVALAVTLLC